MNDLKATSLLQKLYKDSAREGQVSLVSTHDVTNPPVHYCNWSLAYFSSKVFIYTAILRYFNFDNLFCFYLIDSNLFQYYYFVIY